MNLKSQPLSKKCVQAIEAQYGLGEYAMIVKHCTIRLEKILACKFAGVWCLILGQVSQGIRSPTERKGSN